MAEQMAESTEETPPPYTLPGPELQIAVQNTTASTSTKAHYIFVETIMYNIGLRVYIHRHPVSKRYITYPKFNQQSGGSRLNQTTARDAEQIHIAAIQDFSTCQELLNQIMPCVVCAENKAADAKDAAFVSVSEMEVVWKGQGKEDAMPGMKISGKGEEYAQRVLGMMEQRGWRDVIRVKFVLIGK